MSCREYQEQIVLYFCDELDEGQCVLLEAHLKGCVTCAEFLRKEQKLHGAVTSTAAEEPSSALLAQCRVELSHALDRAAPAGFWSRLLWSLSPVSWAGSSRQWMTAHPAMSAAVFLLVGIGLANVAPSMLPPGLPEAPQTPFVVNAAGTFDDRKVTEFQLAGSDATTGLPRIEVSATRDVSEVIEGTPENPEIREALILVLKDRQRFRADARLESLDLLKPYSGDETVRESILWAARNDDNPGVRLRALEGLHGHEQDEKVLLTFVDALLHDPNQGVRVQAINSIRNVVETAKSRPPSRVVEVLRERMEKDPNIYVRLQSQAAMRQLAQRGVY
jgi:hypothetical protein